MLTIADTLATQRPCHDDCHGTLAPEDRVRGAAALLGSMLHEILHASFGDTTKANYGIPFGLPYGVPEDVAPADEEAFLAPFNFNEARGVGVWILGKALFDIDWNIPAARDIGTYGFPGGNALVSVPKGFVPWPHRPPTPRRVLLPARAKARARGARVVHGGKPRVARFKVNEAAAQGRLIRPRRYPDPETVGRMGPRKIGRNEPCTRGTGKKHKDCCGLTGVLAASIQTVAR
jgi:hypothetical protein